MRLFYYANQVYEYSFSRPIYKSIGGTYIVNKYSRLIRFKRYLRNGNLFIDEGRPFLNTPPVILRDITHLTDFEGIIISQSNTSINCDPEKCTTIFMGHGTGDKKYGGSFEPQKTYDYHFISGPKHLQKLRDIGIRIPDRKRVKIGNPSFDDYVNGTIDRRKYLEHLGIADPTRKSILYAPTWKWGNGTLHKYVYMFCKELTKEFNLIVRPHFFERKYIPKIAAWSKLHGIKHVYFSNPANLLKNDTMNDFAVSDLLISDTSSILYEYLITQKPIIIAECGYTDLHKMPESMDIRSVAEYFDGSVDSDILKLVTKSLERREKMDEHKELLDKCFYYNDGHSTDRAVKFISVIQNSSG